MSCKCSPSLVRLMADFAQLGHVNSGCCGDAAHAARRSDHNPDASGYAHAQDVHEKADHDMQPFVDFIVANPAKFPQVKYLIYERVIYYPHAAGNRLPGPYAYTGPNAHAAHLHVSIFADFTHYGGDWLVAEAYGQQHTDPTPAPASPKEDDMAVIVYPKGGGPSYLLLADGKKLELTKWEGSGGVLEAIANGADFLEADAEQVKAIPAP